MNKTLIRFFELTNSFGFALIVGSVIYFILGSVASLVHSDMLDWTFCGTAHYVAGVEWCGIHGSTNETSLNNFVHRLLNVTLPWFMIFWGFVLVGISTLLLKMSERRGHPRYRDMEDTAVATAPKATVPPHNTMVDPPV